MMQTHYFRLLISVAIDRIMMVITNITFYFMLSGGISRNIGENIFRSYTGSTSENNDFHVLVA